MLELDKYKSRELVPVVCERCTNPFYRSKHQLQKCLRKNQRVYCSKTCAIEYNKKHIKIECLECKKTFSDRDSLNRKFCSKTCSGKYNGRRRSKETIQKLKETWFKKSGSYSKRNSNTSCPACETPIKNKSYCNNTCYANYVRSQKIQNGTASSVAWKKYLIQKNGHMCWKCKTTIWNETPIPLELEHIDGDSDNNTKENLEILCPNCHAQTPTYKAKNKGNGRHKRMMRYKEGKSY